MIEDLTPEQIAEMEKIFAGSFEAEEKITIFQPVSIDNNIPFSFSIVSMPVVTQAIDLIDSDFQDFFDFSLIAELEQVIFEGNITKDDNEIFNFLNVDDIITESDMPELDTKPQPFIKLGIKDWANTLLILAKIMAKAVIDEYKNENSPFKEDTPIPKYLDVFLIGEDVSNLIEVYSNKYNHENGYGISYRYRREKYEFWRKIIDNSSYDGYFTTVEFIENRGIKVENKRSITSSVAMQAKKLKIKLRYKENDSSFNGGLIYAYPVEFLEKWFTERGYF